MTSFVLVVHLQIKPDAVDRFMPLALENAKATRETEPGCRQFDVLVDPEDANMETLHPPSLPRRSMEARA